MKTKTDYIKEDLVPAINVLTTQEKTRKEQQARHDAIFQKVDVSDALRNAKKRKQEEDDFERNARKRKQDINKKLGVAVDEHQVLHKLVDKKIGTVNNEITMKFLQLSQWVMEIVRTET
jgi:hypothetical protein